MLADGQLAGAIGVAGAMTGDEDRQIARAATDRAACTAVRDCMEDP